MVCVVQCSAVQSVGKPSKTRRQSVFGKKQTSTQKMISYNVPTCTAGPPATAVPGTEYTLWAGFTLAIGNHQSMKTNCIGRGGGGTHLKMDQWASNRSTVAVPSSLSVRQWLVGERGTAKERFRSDTQPGQAAELKRCKTLGRAMHLQGGNPDTPGWVVRTRYSTTPPQAVSFSASALDGALFWALQRPQKQKETLFAG